jgi:NADP-dependent 3-hydroxy acid dehydrogenase YdfG
MSALAGSVAVVTGAAGGIGRAVSLRLAAEGAVVCMLGRKPDQLHAVLREIEEAGGRGTGYVADLAVTSEIEACAVRLSVDVGPVDILIHAAGTVALGRVTDTSVEDWDRQYAVNVRATHALTRALLPGLTIRHGQIVFMNSTVGLVARGGIGAYAASKHALKAYADTLRAEVNPEGVRVLSIFLGRTATPMQAEVHRLEARPYRPDTLIQPDDVASIVVAMLTLSPTVEVTDIQVRPLRKPIDALGSGPNV